MSEDTLTVNARTLIDYIAAHQAEVKSMDGATPFVVVPPHYQVHDLEKHLPTPVRKRGTTTLLDESSFITYVKKHAIKERTTIYAGAHDKPLLHAVFDDHGADSPSWREHRAAYPCPLSREWQTWIRSNGSKKAQDDFATFIEDNLVDIAEPDPAEMLEVSRTLQAKKSVQFESNVKLEDGAYTFAYAEEVQSRAGRGTLEVPTTFVIKIPVFDGGQEYGITARLRYRISEGGLTMWYDLLRPERVLDEVYRDLVLRVWQATNVPVLYGAP